MVYSLRFKSKLARSLKIGLAIKLEFKKSKIRITIIHYISIFIRMGPILMLVENIQ